MIEKMIPTYADTSVFGGMFDDEFAEASRQFFDQVRAGVYQLFISTVVRDEPESAPPHVKAFFEQMRRHAEIVDVVEEAIRLQRAYLERMEFLMTEEPTGNATSPALSRSDMRPLIRAQLVDLRSGVEDAARRIRHRVSNVHLADVLVRIDRILEAEER